MTELSAEIRAKVDAIRAARNPHTTQGLQHRDRPGKPPRETLSERELEVFRLIAVGKQNREIAEELLIGLETVKTHVRHVLDRLGAKTRAHAVAIGFRTGLLS